MLVLDGDAVGGTTTKFTRRRMSRGRVGATAEYAFLCVRGICAYQPCSTRQLGTEQVANEHPHILYQVDTLVQTSHRSATLKQVWYSNNFRRSDTLCNWMRVVWSTFRQDTWLHMLHT